MRSFWSGDALHVATGFADIMIHRTIDALFAGASETSGRLKDVAMGLFLVPGGIKADLSLGWIITSESKMGHSSRVLSHSAGV